ncbi:hypothetical protein MNV49_004347 [Pseudohyphozyma bogoriensis]|nr:hypothetical protein MNV49_004347 [Pseudohyphozyma bogoriensis]
MGIKLLPKLKRLSTNGSFAPVLATSPSPMSSTESLVDGPLSDFMERVSHSRLSVCFATGVFEELTAVDRQILALRVRVENIKSSSSTISALHARHLSSTTSHEQSLIAAEISALRTEILDEAGGVRRAVVELNQENHAKDDEFVGVRQNHLRWLKTALQKALEEFNVREMQSRQQYAGRVSKEFKIVKVAATEEEIDAILQTRSGEARSAYTAANSRNQELTEIENSLRDVAQMMAEVGELVFAQEDSIVDMEKNACAAKETLIAASPSKQGEEIGEEEQEETLVDSSSRWQDRRGSLSTVPLLHQSPSSHDLDLSSYSLNALHHQPDDSSSFHRQLNDLQSSVLNLNTTLSNISEHYARQADYPGDAAVEHALVLERESFFVQARKFAEMEGKRRDALRAKVERQYRAVKSDVTPEEMEAVSGDPRRASEVFGQTVLFSRTSEARLAFAAAQSQNLVLVQVQSEVDELHRLLAGVSDMDVAEGDAVESFRPLTENDVELGLPSPLRAKNAAMKGRQKSHEAVSSPWSSGHSSSTPVVSSSPSLIIAMTLERKSMEHLDQVVDFQMVWPQAESSTVTAPLLGEGSTAQADEYPHPPPSVGKEKKELAPFIREVGNVKSSIEELASGGHRIAQHHERHVEDPGDGKALEALDNERIHFFAQARKTRLLLQGIEKETMGKKDQYYGVRKSHLYMLKRGFRRELDAFNNSEKRKRDTYRSRVESQYRIVKADVTRNEIEAVLGDPRKASEIFGQAVIQSRTSEARVAFAAAQAKNVQLVQINSNIREASELAFEQEEALKGMESTAFLSGKDVERGFDTLSISDRVLEVAKTRKFGPMLWTIFAGVLLIISFFLPETYGPIRLRWKAQRLSQETGASYVSEFDLRSEASETVVQKLMTAFSRPVIMLCRESIALFFAMYASICFANFYVNKAYGRALVKAGGSLPPEARLPILMVGGFAVPIGLFWFAWTVNPSIHFMVPLIATVIVGFGQGTVSITITNYLVDAYLQYAASALAANCLARSIFGAAFPLFTPAIFTKLGTSWALTLFAFLALAMVPVPFFFYKYGARIRLSSARFSAAPDPPLAHQPPKGSPPSTKTASEVELGK